MINTETYNFGIKVGTRNHKGYFVQDATYRLVSVNQAGWALICQDNTTCHYVDPDHLQDISSTLVD